MSFLDIKEDSHRTVLNAIRIYKEISGAELSRTTKYQPSTIGYILKALEKSGLIEISRTDILRGSTGKPPTLWRMVADKVYIIGIELISNEIRATVIDFACNIVHQEIKSGLKLMRSALVIFQVTSFIEEIMTNLGLTKDKVIGIGVALPGLVNGQEGIVHYSRTLNLRKVGLKKALQDLINLPIKISNDANAGALGIHWHQNAQEILPPNIVFLTANEGFKDMGAGLILNNHLFDGASGTAGELLSLPFRLPDLQRLTKIGGKKFGKSYLDLEFPGGDEEITLVKIVENAKRNYPISTFLLMNMSQSIAKVIIHVIEFINPNLIVIGGNIGDGEFIIKNFILPEVERKSVRIFPIGIQIPKIVFSHSGVYSVSVGATALILREIFGKKREKALLPERTIST